MIPRWCVQIGYVENEKNVVMVDKEFRIKKDSE